MPDDEQQIRSLIENWAEAVHGGDMTGVLADHSDDIVMFDVPPPYEGVRGIDALRLTLGLRKQHGRWVVAHEHHSFPDTRA
jgi:ketosteroid isomerase-like protein